MLQYQMKILEMMVLKDAKTDDENQIPDIDPASRYEHTSGDDEP